MPCSICDDKGFIEEICPECEGNPDEIGGTGCFTCEGDGYIEIECKECNGDSNDNSDNDGNGICPECGRKAEYISIEDDEQYGLSTVKWFCKHCGSSTVFVERSAIRIICVT